MDSGDLEVLKQCEAWLSAGLRCELVTVVKTWGSSPRPPGSLLGLCEGGRIVGSVSGGCIEDDLIAAAQRTGLTRQTPARVKYGVTADEAHRFGLPCGGTMELVIEPLHPRSMIKPLLDRLQSGELVSRRLDLTIGNVVLEAGVAHQSLQITGDELITLHGPRWRVLVIGAGQLSQLVTQMAQSLGYAVTVCDPRDEYTSSWQLAGAALSTEMPDDAVASLQLDGRCAVVALTHDPKLDDLALMEALQSPAFYVGAIGSRKNSQKRRERLSEHFGLTSSQLDRLHSPIGLYIGSKTPAEIAVSIVAELTAVRNGVVAGLEANTSVSTQHMSRGAESRRAGLVKTEF